MLTLTQGKMDGKEFVSHAPGYWPGTPPELWNDWKWQLKNRVTSLTQLEQHLELSNEERSGVLLSGDKLALAVTPHFFNLIPRDNPQDPIRRQLIPRIEETWTSPYDMVDPCGEDSHMPVSGLVHRYPGPRGRYSQDPATLRRRGAASQTRSAEREGATASSYRLVADFCPPS